MSEIGEKIERLQKSRERLLIREQILLNKAITSDNPDDIIKASEHLKHSGGTGDKKSFLVDPNEFFGFGFKDKPTSMSYGVLYAMSKTPIINSIIRTRINQVASFSSPQEDKYAIGYEIRKKSYLQEQDGGKNKLTDSERREIEEIIEFLENGCSEQNWSNGDDFDGFLRKITRDSLVYDQATFEIVRTKSGKIYEFFATDAATYRIADSYVDDEYHKNTKKSINGYYPNYVQVYQNKVMAEFYPWELCFLVRNPLSAIMANNYGVSELEDLMSTVTSLLNGMSYNNNFFKNGSAPKGILSISGNVNETKLREFKQQWKAQMQGVANSFKTPIIESDKMSYIPINQPLDIQWNNYIEFLIKITCAIYLIDPSEINFPLNGSPNQQSLFEGNNEARLQFSKDKGLVPLLKAIEKKINKFIIYQLNPKYEFRFKGLGATDPIKELDNDNKAGRLFLTVNEIRVNRGLKPIEGGDIILDGVYFQQLMMLEQNKQAEQQEGSGDEGGDENPITAGNEEENPITKANENNPITDAFNDYFKKLISSE